MVGVEEARWAARDTGRRIELEVLRVALALVVGGLQDVPGRAGGAVVWGTGADRAERGAELALARSLVAVVAVRAGRGHAEPVQEVVVDLADALSVGVVPDEPGIALLAEGRVGVALQAVRDGALLAGVRCDEAVASETVRTFRRSIDAGLAGSRAGEAPVS